MAVRTIRLFGDPVLRRQTNLIKSVTPEIRKLIADMVETMNNAEGIGIAAPQVGCSERIFVVDISPFLGELSEDERSRTPQQPMIFINPEITWESEVDTEFEEGCLSIPDIKEPVFRPESVQIIYRDENMQEHSRTVAGILARVIQHEYDHLEGILFTDHISAFRRNLLKRRLKEIAQGKISTGYPVQPT